MKTSGIILLATTLLVCGVSGDPMTAPLTIDRMYVSAVFHFYSGDQFRLFGGAVNYVLSDESSWNSGAGSYSPARSTLANVLLSGTEITYTFNAPASGLLFWHTEYNGGDHSAQGELGLPANLSIIAEVGEATGFMSGYIPIISNEETAYGEPRFNYYSAPVGASVYFEQTFTLLSGAVFSPDTFNTEPSYNISGYVDFTNVVPEPASIAMIGLVATGIWFKRRFFVG